MTKPVSEWQQLHEAAAAVGISSDAYAGGAMWLHEAIGAITSRIREFTAALEADDDADQAWHEWLSGEAEEHVKGQGMQLSVIIAGQLRVWDVDMPSAAALPWQEQAEWALWYVLHQVALKLWPQAPGSRA